MQLRPRGFSELIDATFVIVRARFRVLATTAALVMVPVMAFTLLSVLASPESTAVPVLGDAEAGGGGPVTTTTTTTGGSTVATVLMFPAMAVAFVAYVIGFGAMMYIASRAYLGEAVEMGPAVARARARFWPMVRATIAKYVRALGPLILLGVAGAIVLPAIAGGGGAGPAIVVGLLMPVALVWGVVLMLRYAVTGPVVINEDVSGSAALGRSAALTKGTKGRLFGLFLLLFAIMYAVMLTVMFVSMMIFRNVLFAQVLMNVSSLVTYPFAAVLITVVYYDLRIRNEGYDLEVMAGGLIDSAATVLPSAQATPRQPA